MLKGLLFLPLALLVAPVAVAQSAASVPFQLYGGFTYLSNSFNGAPGSRQPLNGWNAGVAFPAYRHLRFTVDFSNFAGTNLAAPQHAYFILGGAEYERRFHGKGSL